ncbi:hypothetical protein LBMAG53_03980 [Planctomycetota bacterium]|nr:hypothetical protein LBMAG53_03980 [Planctomycetota bacterium]
MSPASARSTSLADRFASDGFAGPLALISKEQVESCRRAACAVLGTDPDQPGESSAYLSAWHHHHRWAWDLATDRRLLDAVEQVLGPDLVLWAMHCWYKPPRTGKRIPWHQDASYWAIEPKKTVTVWLALAPTNRANGCLQVIPGSHRHPDLPQVPVSDPRSWFPAAADPARVDPTQAVALDMAAGEGVLFNEATLHGSDPNDSDQARFAVSFRYTSPEVTFLIDRWSDAGRIRTSLVRGHDRFHKNDAIQLASPPG